MITAAPARTPDALRREILRRWQQHVFHALAGRVDSARCEMDVIDALLERLPRLTDPPGVCE